MSLSNLILCGLHCLFLTFSCNPRTPPSPSFYRHVSSRTVRGDCDSVTAARLAAHSLASNLKLATMTNDVEMPDQNENPESKLSSSVADITSIFNNPDPTTPRKIRSWLMFLLSGYQLIQTAELEEEKINAFHDFWRNLCAFPERLPSPILPHIYDDVQARRCRELKRDEEILELCDQGIAHLICNACLESKYIFLVPCISKAELYTRPSLFNTKLTL
jgi:hypothetical protein